MNKIPESYQAFVDYLNSASKEDIQKLAKAIQENSSKKSPEPYQSFIDYVGSASKEEIQKLTEAIQDNKSRDLIYDFIKDIKSSSLNVDTSSNEEVIKR